MGALILILGGARSGKSTYAQHLAEAWGGGRVLFVATAEAGDDEMRARIAAHQQSRPAGWRTIETPRDVAAPIREAAGDRLVVLDCLTLLVANVILAHGGEAPDVQAAERAVRDEIGALLDVAGEIPGTLVVVSNEVGLGLVPPYELGRVYRDLLGWANQRLAARAERVYWLTAGIAVDLKALQMTDPPAP
jgi:adenosylcobinamide kinase / adenosylcobinamide-phosphate guanylyltransferase